eukprot:7180538-Prymnesium_polylepis.1
MKASRVREDPGKDQKFLQLSLEELKQHSRNRLNSKPHVQRFCIAVYNGLEEFHDYAMDDISEDEHDAARVEGEVSGGGGGRSGGVERVAVGGGEGAAGETAAATAEDVNVAPVEHTTAAAATEDVDMPPAADGNMPPTEEAAAAAAEQQAAAATEQQAAAATEQAAGGVHQQAAGGPHQQAAGGAQQQGEDDFDGEPSPEFDGDDEDDDTNPIEATGAWMNCHVRYPLRFLLLHRMRGSGFVVLPGHKNQRVGLKITLDAASIRRAKKGHKHWTTVVMQLLCVGVEQGWWGRTGANN